jgi:hypothetical protein
LNAELRFLPQLAKLHTAFPKLRIVLEHATTKESIEMVKHLGETVACTITAHHLALTVDDWAGQSLHYCKPVAKYPDDREALREVIRTGKQVSNKYPPLSQITQGTHAFSWVRILLHIWPDRKRRQRFLKGVRRVSIRLPSCYLYWPTFWNLSEPWIS